MISIHPCATSSDRRLFERVPEMLHGNDPDFVPPFPGSIAKFLKPDSLFNRHDGKIHAFLARDGSRVVGRIAAIINRSHNKYWDDRVGFFGFFACDIHNPAAAAELFAAAEKVLRAEGCDAMRGPYNPSINEECALQVESEAGPPFISMPWNPPEYVGLVEAAGLSVTRQLFAYHLPLHQGLPARVVRVSERIRKRSANVRIRSFDMKRLDEELALAHRLYNVTLDRNWGFVPISLEDLLASAEDLKAFANPDFLIFAEVDGEPVGLMLTLPNFNEILHRTKGVPHLLRLPWILWLMKTHRIQTVRQVVLGIAPGHRDRGLAALMCMEMVERTQKTAHSAELSWIEANNEQVINIIQLMGATQSRTLAIYEKPLV